MNDRDAWAQWLKAVTVRVAVPNKYHAQRVEVDGIPFDSKKEAGRYAELKLLLASGVIRCLEVHPPYALIVAALEGDKGPHVFETIGEYRPDFRYRVTATDALVVEDVKAPPTKTALYRFKKKFVEAQYGITITEVT
jgi:Protein of unknown function (DUF1064)